MLAQHAFQITVTLLAGADILIKLVDPPRVPRRARFSMASVGLVFGAERDELRLMLGVELFNVFL